MEACGSSPLLPLDLGSHFGIDRIGKHRGQSADVRGRGLRCLVDLQDLSALGEAL